MKKIQIINNMITYDKKPCKPLKWIMFPIVCFTFLLMFTIDIVKPVKAVSLGASSTYNLNTPFTLGFDSLNFAFEDIDDFPTNTFLNVNFSSPSYPFDILNDFILNDSLGFTIQGYLDVSIDTPYAFNRQFSQTNFTSNALLETFWLDAHPNFLGFAANGTLFYNDFLLPTLLNGASNSYLDAYLSDFYRTYTLVIPQDPNADNNYFYKVSFDIGYIPFNADNVTTQFEHIEIYLDQIPNISTFLIDNSDSYWFHPFLMLMQIDLNDFVDRDILGYLGADFTYFSNFKIYFNLENMYFSGIPFLFAEYRYYDNYTSTYGAEIGYTPKITDWYNYENLPYDALMPVYTPVEPVDMTSWLLTSIGAFINAELFPGFAIGGLLAVIVAFPIVIWFLKMLAGG